MIRTAVSFALSLTLLSTACFAATGAGDKSTADKSKPDAEHSSAPMALTPNRQAAMLNNQGVTALNKADFPHAIDCFEQALHIVPDYKYAADNLGIALNNYALRLSPERAGAFFREALKLQDGSNPATQANLDAVNKYIHDHHIPEVSTVEDQRLLAGMPKIDPSKMHFPHGTPSAAAPGAVDFGPYMASLQRTIRSNWRPPIQDASKRVVVQFRIHNDGQLSGLKLDTSSGIPLQDHSALDAVTNAAPFAPLPPNSPKSVDIQFTFDYNVFAGSAKNPRHIASQAEIERQQTLFHDAKKFFDENKLAKAEDNIQKASQITALDDQGEQLYEQILYKRVKTESNLSEQQKIDLLYRALHCYPADDAAALLDSFITKQGTDPHSFDVRVARARDFAKNKKYDEARYEYKVALKINNDVSIRKEMNRLFVQQATDDLIAKWNWALAQASNAENHTGLGKAYETAGNYEKAESEYKTALQIDPYYTMAKDLLASLQARQAADSKKTSSF